MYVLYILILTVKAIGKKIFSDYQKIQKIYYIEKYPCISEPVQFKPVLFKGQLYTIHQKAQRHGPLVAWCYLLAVRQGIPRSCGTEGLHETKHCAKIRTLGPATRLYQLLLAGGLSACTQVVWFCIWECL